MYGVASDGGGALSAAKRIRERRLRCHLDHECVSLRMAVAAAMRHSSGKLVVATAEITVQTDMLLPYLQRI